MAGGSMYVIIGLILIAVLCGGGLFWYLVITAKVAVAGMQRIPMSLCDKHGPYPSTESVYIDVPAEGKADLRQEMCPICFAERMQETKRLLATNVARSFA